MLNNSLQFEKDLSGCNIVCVCDWLQLYVIRAMNDGKCSPELLFNKSTVYCPTHFMLFYILLYNLLVFKHFYFYFLYLYLCIFSCVCIPFNLTVHGADLTYFSLLIILCIVVYVTNTNLES